MGIKNKRVYARRKKGYNYRWGNPVWVRWLKGRGWLEIDIDGRNGEQVSTIRLIKKSGGGITKSKFRSEKESKSRRENAP